MHLKRIVVAAAAMLVVVGVVAGIVTGGFAFVLHRGLAAAGLSASAPATVAVSGSPSRGRTAKTVTSSPGGSSRPAPAPGTSAPTVLPAPVLAAAEPAPAVAAEVAAKIAAVKVKHSGDYSGAVLDVGTGRTVFAHEASAGRIPASTMKLLTSTAALSILGPERTFTTKVVRPSAKRIILVGGGDPYLMSKANAKAFPARASVATLARSTAAALQKKTASNKKKVKRVTLGYDASLFSGAGRNATWPGGYADVASSVSALAVNEGRQVAGEGIIGPRQSDPARAAAEAFATALEKRGVRVGTISPAKAPKAAAPIAAVHSMPLNRIVEQLLMTSDNDAAEVVFRQAAVGAGRPGSFAGGVQAVHARLVKLGVWRSGTKIYDGSGLSRRTKVSATVMAGTLRVAAEQQHPELRAVITGLPVAGVEGSLRVRFFDDHTLVARGVVRGKTGTLRKVHTLAGMMRTRDGSVLVYAFLINNPKNDYNAVIWLDRVTAAISTCGCR